MPRKPESVDPQKLCEIADDVIAAIIQHAQVNRGEWLDPVEMSLQPDHPKSLDGHTTLEIEAATRFLLRLGIIEEVEPAPDEPTL